MLRRSLVCFLSGALFWLVALAGALDDPDVFSLEDFADRTELHHEHIVFLAGLAGLIMFTAAAILLVWDLRVYLAPPNGRALKATFCGSCGARLNETDAFCWNCGTKAVAKPPYELGPRQRV
jgi:hypothetical protein